MGDHLIGGHSVNIALKWSQVLPPPNGYVGLWNRNIGRALRFGSLYLVGTSGLLKDLFSYHFGGKFWEFILSVFSMYCLDMVSSTTPPCGIICIWNIRRWNGIIGRGPDLVYFVGTCCLCKDYSRKYGKPDSFNWICRYFSDIFCSIPCGICLWNRNILFRSSP